MRTELIELIRVIRAGIVTDEALADEVSGIAEIAETGCRSSEAEALRAIVRSHRIRSLEGRAHLAAIADVHGRHLDQT